MSHPASRFENAAGIPSSHADSSGVGGCLTTRSEISRSTCRPSSAVGPLSLNPGIRRHRPLWSFSSTYHRDVSRVRPSRPLYCCFKSRIVLPAFSFSTRDKFQVKKLGQRVDCFLRQPAVPRHKPAQRGLLDSGCLGDSISRLAGRIDCLADSFTHGLPLRHDPIIGRYLPNVKYLYREKVAYAPINCIVDAS